MVKVIAGNEKGQEGKVLSIDRDKKRAVVEGINIISKHTKPNAKNTQGGITKQEAAVHISNLMVIDNKGNATKIGRKFNEDNKLERYSKKSGEVIK